MATELTADNIIRIVAACLPQTEPATSLGIRRVQGVATIFSFTRDALDAHRSEIIEMVSQLPPIFSIAGTGPDSMLKLGKRADGVEWTTDDALMDQLCCLAVGVDFGARLGKPKDWPTYPQGMPYVLFGEMGVLAEDEPDQPKTRKPAAMPEPA